MGIHGVGVCFRGGGPPGVDFVLGCFMHFCHAARFGLVELLIDFCHWCLDNCLDNKIEVPSCSSFLAMSRILQSFMCFDGL